VVQQSDALLSTQRSRIAELACIALITQEERMKKALGVMADNFNTIRTGRANPAILDRITVSE
jgi:hypothetical protein